MKLKQQLALEWARTNNNFKHSLRSVNELAVSLSLSIDAYTAGFEKAREMAAAVTSNNASTITTLGEEEL